MDADVQVARNQFCKRDFWWIKGELEKSLGQAISSGSWMQDSDISMALDIIKEMHEAYVSTTRFYATGMVKWDVRQAMMWGYYKKHHYLRRLFHSKDNDTDMLRLQLRLFLYRIRGDMSLATKVRCDMTELKRSRK